MKLITGKHTVKIIAAFFLNLMVWDIVLPTVAYGLTGGPSQPEVQSFEPVGTTEMVDLFSGDFVYNIPLVDVEGFPINISYHSGVGMDDEASWVGLGWNINPGVVNRNMRGIPDDFQGNPIKSTTNIKEDKTYGITFKPTVEFFGKRLKFYDSLAGKKISGNYYSGGKDTGVKFEVPSLDISLGIMYNTYRGLGYEFSLNPNLSLYNRETNSSIANLGPNLSASSYSGADVDVSLSYQNKLNKESKGNVTHGFSSGFGFNSRQGMSDVTFGYSRSNKKKWSLGRRGSFSVNPLSYTPSIQHAMRNISTTASVTLGPEIVGWNLKLGITGTFHTQFLKSQNNTNYGYGYMYSHDGENNYNSGGSDKNVMFDLNRENDGAFTKEKPLLPLPVFTYDVFSVSGEGTGGMIRPFRSDVGVMHDAEVRNSTVGFGLGLEFGAGNLIKWGADINGNYGYSVSGPWRGKNHDFDIIRHLGFKLPESGSAFEPYYFRSTGEKTLANNDLYGKMLTDEPFNIEVDNAMSGRLNSNLRGITGSFSNIKSDVKYNTRQKRNMAINTLTNYVADKMALDKKIKLYKRNYFTLQENRLMQYDSAMARRTSEDYDHLMSEMTVTNPDGRRYIYGIPAYNYNQYDVNFRVVDVENPGGLIKDRSTGLVNFNAGDNSTGNGRGEDNFYNKTEIPAYAHSFLLSSIASPDYVDVTGNGVSDDDLGTAVKLNYTRTYSNYKWRTPFGRGIRQGNYDEGLKSDIYDDKANYIYGEKEIWYVHSIESKNYVACFYTSRRDDACQVLGEDGGIDTSASFYKLDSIKLFTKEELIQNGSVAVPLKTVHFEYDYSLCLNTENNRNYSPGNPAIQSNTGKLTLKKIYFTYGKSQKGRTNSYQFTYSDYNPSYNIRGYDRWGNFKPNATKDECDNINDASKRLSNVDDPYVLQNKDSADLYSSAWSLKKIKLPSGGSIEVNYESDDYAYIQDKQAGQMFKVTGINNTKVYSNASSKLYDGNDNKMYVFFDLVEPISQKMPDTLLNKMKGFYFRNIDTDKMYFKFLVDLTNKGDYDFVTGYADKHEVGFASKNPSDTNYYDVGYVKLKEAPLKDRKGEINPITKAAWNFMRLYAPKKLAKIFSNYEMPPASGDALGAMRSLAGSISEMGNMFTGFGKTMRQKSAGQKFVFNKSFIRLSTPTKMKFGGGVRVKKLQLSDSWNGMVSGQSESVYGQEYIYTKEEKLADSIIRTISSGVATWEPGIGNDENSHKLPMEYSSSNALAPNDRFIIEKPVGESFFPAPSVGYSQVTTVNIKPTTNIKRTATGKVVNEFYTAKDFPVIVRNTNIDKKPKNPKLENTLFSLLKVYVRDRMYVSQGYSIELNDMHGKPKAQWVYEEGNEAPISGVKYEYRYAKNIWGQNQLVSSVNLASPDGSISSGEIGREVDYMIDTRNFYSFHIGGGAQFNVESGIVGVFPMIASSLFGSITSQELEFGSVVNTKVIMRYGILKETAVFENGATVKTENVLFDSETGDVLLSKTTNEFNDTIYTFNYPAHYAYTGMEQAYKNLGFYFKGISINNGKIYNVNNYTDYFVPGDEMYIEYEEIDNVTGKKVTGIMPERVWAVESPHHSDQLIFMTRTGVPFNTNKSATGKTYKYNLTIIRSGRRNMASASIGTVVSLNTPIANGALNFDSIANYVINSGAVEFSDAWPAKHLSVFDDIEAENSTQPFFPPNCSDSCLVELKTLLFPVMATAEVGDTINLMKAPYRDYFLCQIDEFYANHIPCGFNYDDYYFDSLLIYESQHGGLVVSNTPKNLFFNNDIKYAKTSNTGDPLYASNKTGLILPAPFGFYDNEPEFVDKQDGVNSIQKLTSIPACNLCDYITTPSASDTVRVFRTSRGCKREFTKRCTDINAGTINAECAIPKVKKIECPYSIPPFISLYAMTLTPAQCKSRCGDNFMIVSDIYIPCGDGGSGVTKTAGYGGGGACEDCVCGDTAYDGYPILNYMNPYVYGIKGNWRPKRNWLFYNKREQSTITNTRKDGTYNDYVDFWKKPTIPGKKWANDSGADGKWTWNTLVTKFNRTGNEIENMDALNIYSSALFGYGNSIVKAVANNARHRQIVSEGFEDYNYPLSKLEEHFSFANYENYVNTSRSHTGVNSIYLNDNSSISYLNYIFLAEKEPDTLSVDTSVNVILLKPTDLIEHFSPDSGKYIISAWISEDADTPKLKYTDSILIKTYKENCVATFKFVPSGPIIEGWQRIEGVFELPDSLTCIEILLKSDSVNGAYFDDVRIHPWQANMKSFVYHPQTLRLVAELDENNYATFYEYDDEGRLVRIKRETERGIVTLQESRTGLKIKSK